MLPSGNAADSPPSEATAARAPKEDGPFRSDTGTTETRLERRDNGHFYTKAEVNGFPVDFVVDTGASTVALTIEDARRIGLHVDPAEFTVIGRTASGEAVGKEIDLSYIDVEGKRVSEVRGVIIDGLHVSLLGQSYLGRISGVEMSGEHMTLR